MCLETATRRKFRDCVLGLRESVAEESLGTGQGLIHCNCKTGCSAARCKCKRQKLICINVPTAYLAV